MNNWNALATMYAQKFGVPPNLFERQIQAESAFNPDAVSPAGARGLAQLMPATARDPGFGVQPVTNIDDPEENLRGGAEYMGAMLRRYKGDKEAALVAYNAGPGTADKWVASGKKIPLPEETKNYVAKIAGQPETMMAQAKPLPVAFGSDLAAESLQREPQGGMIARTAEKALNFAIPTAQAADQPVEPQEATDDEILSLFATQVTQGRDAQEATDDEILSLFTEPDQSKRGQYEDVLRQQNLLPGQPEPPRLPADDTFWKRVGYGAGEMALGAGQRISKLTGLNEENMRLAVRDTAAEQKRLAPEGIDFGRAIGNAAAVVPAVAGLPAGASMVGAAGYGALTGGAVGALTPIQEDQAYGDQTALNIGGGALAGAVGGPIGRAVGAGAEKLLSGVSNVVRRMIQGSITPDKASKVLEVELRTQGIDFKQLSKAAQDSLKAEVMQAMKVGELNPEALANSAAFKELGIQPTKGQVTRDPKQWQDEFNLRQLTGGEELMGQYRNATTGLARNIDDTRAGTGGADVSPYSVGEQSIGTLGRVDAGLKGQVDDAYSAARSTVGIDTPLDSHGFSERVIQTLDDQQVGDKLPSALRSTLNQISKGEFPFTIQKAEQLLRAANQRASNTQDKVEKYAIGVFQKELRDAIDQAGSAEGKAAATAFQNARKLASGRFQLQEAVPALKAVTDGDIHPDDFLKKFVFGAKVEELGNLKDLLLSRAGPEGVQGWNNIRAQLIDKLKAASVQGEGSDMRFLQAAYNKALNSFPKEKLEILLSPKEIQKLRLIGKVGRAVQQEPAGAVPNRSGTAAAVFNRLGSVLEAVPGLGLLGGVIVRGTLKAGQGGVNSMKASRATGKPDINVPRNALLPDSVRDLITRGGALGGGLSANALLQ